MAGLVTNFMAAASIVTTAHVHQEAASGLELLARSPIPDLVIVSKTDVPEENDSSLTKIVKNVGLTYAFTKAGVERSRLSLALKMAEVIADPKQPFLENGGALFLGLKNIIPKQSQLLNSDLLKRITDVYEDIDKGMIVYDPKDDGFAKGASGLKGASNTFIPGTEEDLIALKLAHEAGHAVAGRSEQKADQFAFESYQNAVSAGQPLSLDFLHSFRAMRTIYDMSTNPNDTALDKHTYASMNNFQWEKDTERFSDEMTPEQYRQAVTSVQNMLYEKAGISLETPKMRLNSLDMLFPSSILSDANKQKIALADTPEEQAKIMDQAHLSAEQKSLYFEDTKNRQIDLGYNAAIPYQPELAYNAALQIQSEIEKRGNETEKLFLKRYIEAAQRYQPELFGVQDADRKSNTPVTDRGITLMQVKHPAPAPLPTN